jgi:hypothetical protein
MAYRTYSDDEKQAALEVYKELGPAEAGRQTGIPSGTIRAWASKAGTTVARGEAARAKVDAAQLTWAQRRAEIATQTGEAAQEFLNLARRSTRAQTQRTHMASFAVAVEKAQLLDGAATERVEQVSADEGRARVKELRDELEQRRQEKAAAS